MKKLTQKAETFQILRNTGKSIQELQPIIDLPLETTQIKPKRIIKPLKKLSPRHIVVQELLEKSQIPITTITKALNYNRCYVNELKKKLEKTSLVTLQRVKLAHRTISDKMKMKPVEMEKVLKDGKVVKYMDYPPHAVALDAAKTIAHQYEPVIQRHQNETVNITLMLQSWTTGNLSEKISGLLTC